MSNQLTIHAERKHYFPDASIDNFGDIEEIAKELRAKFEDNEIETWDEFATNSDVFADFMDFVAEWAIERRDEILTEYTETWNGKHEHRTKKQDLTRAQTGALKRYKDFRKMGIIKETA